MARRKTVRGGRSSGDRKREPSKQRAGKKRIGSHPPHPKCPGCQRALYKRMDAGPVRTSDAWAWCRYEGCPLSGRNQSKPASKRVLPAAGRR